MNLFELYNGLQRAQALNKGLGLEEAIKSLEVRYGDAVLRKNDIYLQIEAGYKPRIEAAQGAALHI